MARVSLRKYTVDAVTGNVTATAEASYSDVGTDIARTINPLNLVSENPAPIDSRVATGLFWGGAALGYYVPKMVAVKNPRTGALLRA